MEKVNLGSNLSNLVKSKESQALEFKSSLANFNEIVDSVCGFANTTGGKIIIGISDAGKIIGADIGKDTIERLTNKITGNIEPKIYPKILIEEVDNKKIIIIEVKEASDKPVLVFGRAYKRVGKSTIKVSKDEYEQMILEKHKEKLRFDSEICKEASLKDIDEEKVRWFLKKRADVSNTAVPTAPLEQILLNIKAVVKEKGRLIPTYSGILFFGKDPQKFLLRSQVKAARFKGTDMLEFIDEVRLKETLPEIVEEAIKFVRRNTRTASKILDFERINVPEYPYDAIREAIINALAHRDYRLEGTIRIMLFDDRIEIDNPGIPPLPISKLEGRHLPRNEFLCERFHDIGYMEEYGTGITKMKKLMKEHGLKIPQMKKQAGFFGIAFYGPGDKILDLIPNIPEERRMDLRELGLNERQIEALRLMVNEGREISNKQYRELFDVSRATATRDLNQLASKDLIAETGKGRSLYYHSK